MLKRRKFVSDREEFVKQYMKEHGTPRVTTNKVAQTAIYVSRDGLYVECTTDAMFINAFRHNDISHITVFNGKGVKQWDITGKLNLVAQVIGLIPKRDTIKHIKSEKSGIAMYNNFITKITNYKGGDKAAETNTETTKNAVSEQTQT
jgi:hypothetical protein